MQDELVQVQPKFKSNLLEAVEVFREDVMTFTEAYEMVIQVFACCGLKCSVACLYAMTVMSLEEYTVICTLYKRGYICIFAAIGKTGDSWSFKLVL